MCSHQCAKLVDEVNELEEEDKEEEVSLAKFTEL